MVGEFKNGRGEFCDQELWKGRAVYVRFVWSEINPEFGSFRAILLERWGQNLGGQVDHGPDPG
jgi:hypothetical protein